MKKEELFQRAYAQYKLLNDVCDEFYQNVIKKYYPNVDSMGLFVQLDKYLQAILIGIAASDNKFDTSELVFIDQLTDHGNIFDGVKGGVKVFANATEEQIKQLLSIVSEYSLDVPLILKIIAKLDSKIKDINYAELVLKRFFSIITCLTIIDSNSNPLESQTGIRLIAPLVDLFPKVNVKAFLKK